MEDPKSRPCVDALQAHAMIAADRRDQEALGAEQHCVRR